MDPLKGIHAIATTLFAIFMYWITYGFVSNFIGSVAQPTLNIILWVAYIMTVIVSTLVTPALIAFGEDSDASIASMTVGTGLFFFGVLVMTILSPMILMFVGDSTVGSGVGALYQNMPASGVCPANTALSVQTVAGVPTNMCVQNLSLGIMSLLWIIAVVFLLFICPVVAQVAPILYMPAVKQKIQETIMQ